MYLSKDDEKGLGGNYGEAVATAYRILVAVGESANADRLIPIEWSHVSGVNYNTIGSSGRDFLEELASDPSAKAKVPTTLNPMGFDRSKKDMVSEEFFNSQNRIVQAYRSMEFTLSFTCIPYEAFFLPGPKSNVSFAETNAAIYVNSILGLHTNKESALSALASSLIGKTPFSGLLVEENRYAKARLIPKIKLETEIDFGLFGFHAGKTIRDGSVSLGNTFKEMDRFKLKAFSAGLGTSGTCGMFTSEEEIKAEMVDVGKEELETIKDELNTAESGDIITLGSPQLGMVELNHVSNMVEDKKFTKKCFVFCPRTICDKAKRFGVTDNIEKAGAEIICDSCTCLSPLFNKNNTDSIITNSVKAAYYMKHSNKLDVHLSDLNTILTKYTEKR